MRKFIVVVSPSYGGSEKRFFDIFTCMYREDVSLAFIAPSMLIDQIKDDYPDRSDVFPGLMPIAMTEWSRLQFIYKFFKLMRTIPPRTRFHYPLNCLWFLHLGRGDRVTMSMTDCLQVPGLFMGSLSAIRPWVAFFFVEKVDVLSPASFEAMSRYRMASKMSLTPGGTFVLPPPTTGSTRLPQVVLFGRLAPLKGIDDFLDVVPAVWAALSDRVPSGFSFAIAGYGPLQEHVTARVADLAASGVPIVFVGYAVAEILLSQSTVLLSLQEVTNYPSRVVAEALLAGCGVLVRDTGDSRQFGSDIPGLLYCNKVLDPVEIADHLAILLRQVLNVPGFSEELRRVACAKFYSRLYIDYFREIMAG